MKKIRNILLNDKFILGLIFINAVIIFLQGFDLKPETLSFLSNTDNFITFIFILELISKLNNQGIRQFLKSNWNIFDAILILFAIPSLLLWVFNFESLQFDYLLVLRITRIFKFFRFIRFFPDIDKLINGVQRALKASVIVLIGFFIFIFIVSIISCFFYKKISPEFFGDPFVSLYSIFKIFTVEGWYEIPDSIAENSSVTTAVATKIYFVLILLAGGIFGLSLVNSIFVDAMVSDNNDELERKVISLEHKIDNLIETLKK
ncbi:ion transporter [Alkaliflexus imshenetskii]|uniref:ion transporter n=1 Tax=Alkaliflexus imshenetskii TaxID=286730 RepID=UPI0004B3CBCB|nr:ion transporter [Alkaliflexus imshenetskii]